MKAKIKKRMRVHMHEVEWPITILFNLIKLQTFSGWLCSNFCRNHVSSDCVLLCADKQPHLTKFKI